MRSLLLVGGFLLLFARQVVGQDAIGDPRLELRGPVGQSVVFSIRYYNGDQAVETVHARTLLTTSPVLEQLDLGHTGIHVKAITGSTEPVTLNLLDGEKVVATSTSKGPGEFELRHGNVPNNASLELPRTLPNEAEMGSIESFLAAIRTANTQGIVSTSPVANIDWQTLNAYCRALIGELGQPVMPPVPHDGWVSWEGSLGARVLAGVVHFENGQCQFKLMLLAGKLVDVVPISAEMPDDWYAAEPANFDEYVQRAHALARAIFSGDANQAHTLFSARFHDEVSVEQLAQLSQQMRAEYGSELSSARLLRSGVDNWSAESLTRRISIDSELGFENGKRCISRVDFALPVAKDTLARSHLAAINLREAWHSAHPDLARQVTQALELIGSEQGSSAAALRKLLHPEVEPLMVASRLDELLTLAGKRLGKLQFAPQYSLWSASIGDKSTAIGPAAYEFDPAATIEAQFADGKLLGLTVYGQNFSGSTLDLIPGYEQTHALGQQFWTKLLSGDFTGAHGLLAEDFKQQLPLAEFEKRILASHAIGSVKLKSVHRDALRLADRDDRALPIMLAGFYVAEFEDGSFQPLHCEFRATGDPKVGFDLLNFSTDVNEQFPVASSAEATKFFAAFLNKDVEAVVALSAPGIRSDIDREILQGFLDGLHIVLGDKALGESADPSKIPVSTVRQYADGKQILIVLSLLNAPSGAFPVEARFEGGHLSTFHFQHPQVGFFVDRIHNHSGIEAKNARFLTTWLNGDMAETSEYFVSSLRTPAIEKRLTQVRDEFLFSLGDFVSHKTLARTTLPETNQLHFDIELQFQTGTRTVQLTYDVNAFTAYLSAVVFPTQ